MEFPRRINIQTHAGCNAKCIFCPSPQISGQLPLGKMDWDLFTKIVDECAQHEMERINPFSQNEPLLDRDIAKRVAYIKEQCGDRVTVLIITNGSLLTETLMNDFIDAGLDRLKVSLQGLTKETFERVMVGLNYEQTYARVEAAIAVLRRRGAAKPRLSVSTITTGYNEHEIRRWKHYWRRRGIKASASAYENRGGNIAQDPKLHPYGLVPKMQCTRPSHEAVVVYNGDVVLCCVDWWRTTVLGNLNEQSLEEIWNSEKVKTIRWALAEGEVEAMPKICRECQVSDLASRQHVGPRGLLQRARGFFRRRRSGGSAAP